ncbi:MAG: cytochrome c biogenesis protein ResB [Acidobacteriota bacterium]
MRRVTFKESFLILLILALFVNLCQIIYKSYIQTIQNRTIILVIFGFVFFPLLTFFYFMRDEIFTYLKSVKFAISLFMLITFFTILGTFLVQDQPFEFYQKYLGNFFSKIAILFFLDTIYRNWWFNFFLIILSFSLFFCTVTKKKLNWKELGFYLNHFGIIVILLGALIGHIWGVKGYMDMFIGETKNKINIVERGVKTNKFVNLGFEVELVKFRIEEYNPEYRVLLYKHKPGKDTYKLAISYKPEERTLNKIPGSFHSFKILDYYPDFERIEIISKKSEKPLNPVLKFSVEKNGTINEKWIFLNEDKSYFDLSSNFAIHFLWEKDDEFLRNLSYEEQAGKNLLEISQNSMKEEIYVENGKEYKYGDFIIRILGFYPDFTYDAERKQALSLSDEPKNPALRIEIEDSKAKETNRIWIFAKVGGFERQSLFNNRLNLRYKYLEHKRGVKTHLVFLGKTKEILRFGREKNVSIPMKPEEKIEIDGSKISFLDVYPEAERKEIYRSKSSNPLNPAVLIGVYSGDNKEQYLLVGNNPEPIFLENGKFAISFERKSDEIKDYVSTLKVYKNDKEMKSTEVEVNHPLKFEGYEFYQSNYDPKNPEYSGIQIVKDPGVNVVWLGFVMLFLGLLHIFFIKRRILLPEVIEE